MNVNIDVNIDVTIVYNNLVVLNVKALTQAAVFNSNESGLLIE